MKTFLLLFELATALAVETLGDRAFRRREASQAALTRLGELVRPALVRGTKHADPEVSRRCTVVLAGQWTPLREVRDWISRKDLPWIYLGWSYESAESKEYADRVTFGSAIPDSIPEHPHWREATRIWLTERLSEGHCPRQILEQLNQMRQAESDYRYRGRP